VLTPAPDAPADPKFFRVVDHSLHPQDPPSLLVHLDPVPLHAVLDAPPGQAAVEPMVELIRHRLAFELAVPLAPQEAEDVPGREIQRAVLQQAGEELRQVLAALEHEIRRILGLGGHPVVRHRGQHVREKGFTRRAYPSSRATHGKLTNRSVKRWARGKSSTHRHSHPPCCLGSYSGEPTILPGRTCTGKSTAPFHGAPNNPG